jgi:hypothetical protein
MLLQRSVPVEEIWEQTGETALSMAVSYDDVAVRTNSRVLNFLSCYSGFMFWVV